MYEASIESVFGARHALRLADGSLEPVHGHAWRVTVTVGSAGLDAMDCVMDFHALEARVEAIVGPWRNGCLNDLEPFCVAGQLVINPSAERVAEVIALAVTPGLPQGVALRSVRVGEAPGCIGIFLA